MIQRFSEERGVAMITALLVSMVVLTISVAVIALSLHNSQISAFDRKRIQSVDAAEAGIDAWFSGITKVNTGDMCDAAMWDGTLPNVPGAAFDVSITLYSTWPPLPGTEITCPGPGQPLATQPLGALVVSKGTAVASSNPVSVSRTMQSEVKLTPIYGGFNKAIFSDTQLNLLNKLTANGYQANDADVYTNGNLALNNNTVIAGSAYAQGFASISQGIVKQDVWANNYAVLSNGIEVFGNTTSSTSYISLSSNSTIDGNAKAGTTIGGGTIKGTKTANSPSGPPPQTSLPQLTFNQQAWVDAGYTVSTFATCATAKAFIDSAPSGNNVVRVTPTCAAGGLSWGNNSTINVKGNLAIFVDGGTSATHAISTVNQTNWNAVGGEWTVYFVVPYRQGLNCTKPSPYDISVSNNTGFNNGLKVFVYSQCNVDFGNNNANGVNGQIIGGTVTITNQMTLNYVPILVPGFNLLGYNIQPSYLREIANS
jgi:hypothetical protein